MGKELYIKILDEILPKLRKYSNEDWQLQFYNDLKHTSKMTLKYLKVKKVNVLKCLPYSPKISLIESIWRILEERLTKRYKYSSNLISEIENA